MLLTVKARAYINYGRWVADCPQTYCNSALALEPGEGVFACRDPLCRVMSDIEWPPNASELFDVLRERPNPANRNWYPASHDLALRFGRPHGQTVADLRDETRDHEED